MQAALGPDFAIGAPGDGSRTRYTPGPNIGPLRLGTPSATELPSGFNADVVITAVNPPTKNTLRHMCAPREEKGLVSDACVERPLPNGKVVQVQHSTLEPAAAQRAGRAGPSVRVIFQQADGVLVLVDLVTNEDPDRTTGARTSAARAWVESMLDRLGAAVTDPDVDPAGSMLPAVDPATGKAPVPDVVGIPKENAVQWLEGVGFRVEVDDERGSSAVDPGSVVRQVPAAGQKIKPGSTVFLGVASR